MPPSLPREGWQCRGRLIARGKAFPWEDLPKPLPMPARAFPRLPMESSHDCHTPSRVFPLRFQAVPRYRSSGMWQTPGRLPERRSMAGLFRRFASSLPKSSHEGLGGFACQRLCLPGLCQSLADSRKVPRRLPEAWQTPEGDIY